MTIQMFDSVTITEIPANPAAVAGYVGGNWPTYGELVNRFPHAHHLSIAVNAGERARCLDIESGDATIDQAAHWLDTMADRSQGKPVLYTSAGNISTLRAAVGNREYLLWSAHYTYQPHVCGQCGYPPADLTQFSDKALGRNLDESLVGDQVFGPATPPEVPHPKLHVDYFDQTHEQNCPDVHVWKFRVHNHVQPLVSPRGAFGPEAEAVARRLQEKHGLTVDGKVGPQTWGLAWAPA